MSYSMPEIMLGGYNIDADVLKAIIAGKIKPEDAVLTPETIAAAYGRVSRSNKTLAELRREAVADVRRARESVENITHKMGHKSIAEHAYFNLDFNGVSRLAVELIEQHRLAAYTERSQRFVKFGDDFFVPPEIVKIGLADKFVELYQLMFRTYNELYVVLRKYFFEKDSLVESQLSAETVKNLENLAKEDARYAIGLAVQTTFGGSFNGNELELVIRHLLSHESAEARFIGDKIKELVQPLAPSLVKYCMPVKFFQSLPAAIAEAADWCLPHLDGDGAKERVNHLEANHQPDEVVIAAILYESKVSDFQNCLAIVKRLSPDEKKRIYWEIMRRRQIHDNVTRHFEMAEFTFDLVVSASLYAQLKRHRICTQLPVAYQLDLGHTVPASIQECDLVSKLEAVIEASEMMYQTILDRTDSQFLATYALTNAHRRRIIVKMNLREFFHFAKERCAQFAQWDIRHTADKMVDMVKLIAPLTGELLCGKDVYEKIREEYSKQFEDEE